MRKLIIAALMALALSTACSKEADQPNCPYEDSCTANYENGEWHIEPTTP